MSQCDTALLLQPDIDMTYWELCLKMEHQGIHIGAYVSWTNVTTPVDRVYVLSLVLDPDL